MSTSSSPPPYDSRNPEQQSLLVVTAPRAFYSGQLPPDSPGPNKRAGRYWGEDEEYRPDSRRPSGHYSRRSRSRSPADDSHITCPVWMTVLLLFVVGFLGFYSGRPSESEHNDIRERWDVERRNHTLEVEKWYKDRDDRRTQEAEEIERFKKEKQDLIDKKRKMIDDFTLEEARWLRKMDFYKNKEKDLIRRQEEMDDMYRAKEQLWLQKIARFEEEWQRMIDEENQKRERARLYWDDIQGDKHCLASGRKKYTARLANLTPSLDGMEACKYTPITLNGVTYDHPINCENAGSHGIRGHWIAENEGVCATYWEPVKMKDCTTPRSGYRRVEAKFGVVHNGEDRETLCLTTPLTINGHMYSRPTACPDWGTHGFWGIWNVPDDQCK